MAAPVEGAPSDAVSSSRAYGELLRTYRGPRMRQRPLARAVGLNPTLINRSEKGHRLPAGPGEVVAIAEALGLSPEERDRLLAAAGYWPAVFLTVGPGDDTLRSVAAVLADPSLPDDAKHPFRAAVEALVAAVAAARRAAHTPPGEGA